MKIRAFITHKKAERFEDCQDRFSINRKTKSVAVSDGMSQSIFQKIWAEILVDAYTTEDIRWCPSEDIENKKVHEVLSAKWRKRVDNRLRELQEEGKLTYLSEGMLAEGKSAGATLAGIRFNGQAWKGDVLGDTCVIEVQNDKIVQIHTSQDTDTFDNYPDYYDSNPQKKGKGKSRAISGQLPPNGLLLIVSDPFSDLFCELLKQDEEKVSALLVRLLSLKTHEEFEELISDLRTNAHMHNDDSTLVMIEYDADNEFNIDVIDNIRDLASAEEIPVLRSNPFHIEPMPQSEQETSSVNNEDTQLKTEIVALKEENKALKQDNMELKKEVDELKNGCRYKIKNKIKKKFSRNKHKKK